MTGCSSSRGRRLPMILMLLAIVAAMAVAIGVGLAAGGMAAAKKPAPKPAPKPAATTGATIKATPFEALAKQTTEAHAMCPGKKRALGGGVVQIGPPTKDLLMV